MNFREWFKRRSIEERTLDCYCDNPQIPFIGDVVENWWELKDGNYEGVLTQIVCHNLLPLHASYGEGSNEE